jgi:hypothetical protein
LEWAVKLTELERITAVEVRLTTLEEKMDKMDKKLDDLLALRNKGAGVLWFFGPVGLVILELIHYFWSK